MSNPTDIEFGKQSAAISALNEYCHSNMIIGIGSGSTIIYLIQELIERIKLNKLSNIQCIPTSFQSKQLIQQSSNLLGLNSLDEYPQIDIAFDGADEVDLNGNLIKGGGACMFQEKIVAERSVY